MGIVDPMAIGVPLWTGVVSFGWDAGLSVFLGAVLGVATAGMLSRVRWRNPQRRGRGVPRVRLATAS